MKRKFLIQYEVKGVKTTLPLRIVVEEEDEIKARKLAITKINFLSMYKDKQVTILSCVESRQTTFQ